MSDQPARPKTPTSKPTSPKPAPDWGSLPVSGGSLGALDPISGVSRVRPVSLMRTGTVSERRSSAPPPSPSPAPGHDAAHLNQVAHVIEMAQLVLGSEAAALTWLKAPHVALGGLAPMNVMASDAGAAQVLRLLDKM